MKSSSAIGEVQGAMKAGGIGRGVAHGAAFGAAMPGDLQDKVTTAGTGATIAGALGGVGKIAPEVAKFTPKAVDAVKEVSAKLVKSFDEMINAPTSFDMLKEIKRSVGDKVSEQTISQARLRNLNNDLTNYSNLLDVQQNGEYMGKKLDNSQLKSVKRQVDKLEYSLKTQKDFINENIIRQPSESLLEGYEQSVYPKMVDGKPTLSGKVEKTNVEADYNLPVDGYEIKKVKKEGNPHDVSTIYKNGEELNST